MARAITAKALLSRHIKKSDRILLVNPPVEETRYSWLKWNQPLDLLKIATHLRTTKKCKVELFDCMKPDKSGDVPTAWLPRDRRYLNIGQMRYPMRLFGNPLVELKGWLKRTASENPKATPTQVWITSLCSHWLQTVADACRTVHEADIDAKIVLIGNYPRLMPEHACEACAADLAVTSPINLKSTISAFDLYGDSPPPFIAVGMEPEIAVSEIEVAVKNGVNRVAFFADDLCVNQGLPLVEIVERTKALHRHLRYHAICGLHPNKMTSQVAEILADRCFAEFHFEEASANGEVDLESYRRVTSLFNDAKLRVPDDRMSGFVWIGRPNEQLEQIILRSFHVVNACGGLILKPFSPTPGSPEHLKHKKYLDEIPLQNWSPHFFPFAELNGISRSEYHDLYRMAAFLNERVRNRAFDFLNGTLGAEMLRESLSREVWKLDPSPLRIAD